MAIPIGQALRAYTQAAHQVGKGQGAFLGQEEGSSFADMLANAGQSALKDMRHAESLSAQAVQGKANISDVVTAVTNSEITLQAVVAMRDKMVSSLQEIMRMPI
jgi:flagellar hook-basal body complex protein FliE